MKDPKKLSDLELLQLCLDSNDQAAWFEFVSRFQPLIARVVVKAVRLRRRAQPDLVADLVQETFVKLFDNDRHALRYFHFQNESSMYAFLKVIAVHVVEDWWRGEIADKRGGGRDLVDVDGVNISDAGAASPQRVTEIRALYARIARCLAKLKNEPNYERDRGMFWLYYAYGFTAKEISELPGIGLTIKGVESTLFRLVKFVRACLNGML